MRFPILCTLSIAAASPAWALGGGPQAAAAYEQAIAADHAASPGVTAYEMQRSKPSGERPAFAPRFNTQAGCSAEAARWTAAGWAVNCVPVQRTVPRWEKR